MNHKILPHPLKRWIDSVNQTAMTLIHAFKRWIDSMNQTAMDLIHVLKRKVNSVNQTDTTQRRTITQITSNAIDIKQCIPTALSASFQKRMVGSHLSMGLSL